ncbi:aminotransferase class V-fold PLP-dependent enzyme [Alloiococcus sp. CFN-8]|uniref:aminotransferase class V-fold PLP-dependent enzyme n=1 Tax=Alloiococcus sp. CFN-8 TaxID=3416081 RepID=UPI003CF55143
MYMNMKDYRSLFMGLEEYVPVKSGKYVVGINFDNAATTPPFKSVIDNIAEFSGWYSSIHRGKGYKSKLCDEFYEEARKTILDFLDGSPEAYNIIYVKNTTEGINKLAYRLIDCREGVILSTRMEHHSNDLPWRGKCKVDYVEVDDSGRLSLEDLSSKLEKYKNNIKLFTFTGISNVTGIQNDVNFIAELCHSYGCRVMVDGAQLIPHKKVKLKGNGRNDYIDYLVFSAHKMYAPFGLGIIVVPKECFINGEPEYKGGGTVKFVTDDEIIWDEPPHKEEAGTPNFFGIVALLSAMKELSRIGMKNIEERERILTEYFIREIRKIQDITIYGDNEYFKDRVGIISFNLNDFHHDIVSDLLAEEYGIQTRSGCFCAHPYVQRLLKMSKKDIEEYKNTPGAKRPGMVRVSLGLYNDREEIDYFLNALELINRRQKSVRIF